MQLLAIGQSNIILTGNPQKTFFRTTFKTYSPFGMQRFRLSHEGQRTLSVENDTVFEFKIPRYADLLWDTYIVVNIPDIWSPIYYRDDLGTGNGKYLPYEFKWVKELGFTMIRQVTIHSGGSVLAQYSGEWMANAVKRDECSKQTLINRMIGHDTDTEELTNPSKQNNGEYPHAIYDADCTSGLEPSIRGRKLYIPLMAWFCASTKTALPLIALQYQEINVKIEFRPIKELFTILKVTQEKDDDACLKVPAPMNDKKHQLQRIAPDTTNTAYQFWRFIQTPPNLPTTTEENDSLYKKRRVDWKTDIHLLATYIFLGNEERRTITAKKHRFLTRCQYQWDYLNLSGPQRVNIPSRNMVSSYMWRFRRTDVYMRNEWHNYQNYEFENEIQNQIESPTNILTTDNPMNLKTRKCKNVENIKDILFDMSILCGQEYRENILDAGVYNYVEKVHRTTGIAKDGLYCYNFCTNSNHYAYQPTGAQNTNKWKHITFDFNTILPPKNTCDDNSVEILCDASNNLLGIRKNNVRIYKYNFDLRIFEERYNTIEIQGGRIGMLFAR